MIDFEMLHRRCRQKVRRRWMAGLAILGGVVVVWGGLQWWYLVQAQEGHPPLQRPISHIRDLSHKKRIHAEDNHKEANSRANKKEHTPAPQISKHLPKKKAQPLPKKSPNTSSSLKHAALSSSPQQVAPKAQEQHQSPPFLMLQAKTPSHQTDVAMGAEEDRVAVLQLAMVQRKNLSSLQKEHAHLQQQGNRCYIKPSQDGIHFYLRCLLGPSQRQTVIPRLRQAGIDAMISYESAAWLHQNHLPLLAPLNVDSLLTKRADWHVSKKMMQKRTKVANLPASSASSLHTTSDKHGTTSSVAVEPHSSQLLRKTSKKLLQVNALEDIARIEQRFAAHPSFAIAYALARHYYTKKAYEKAALWAKRANRLDSDDSRAWILYARAIKAQGRRQEAMKLLRAYLYYRHSQEAQRLLRRWSME